MPSAAERSIGVSRIRRMRVTAGRRRRLFAGVVATGVIAGCAGCGAARVSHNRPSSAGKPVVYSVSGLRQLVAHEPCPLLKRVPISSRAQLRALDPVAAMTCTEAERTYRDGEWAVAISRASASGIASLERDFERPDQPARPNAICAAVVVFGAPVLFVDRNGHFLRARYPVDHTCDQPLESVIKAVAAHHWITVATTKVRQQLTPAELAAGCPGEMKNMVAIDLQMGIGRSRGGPVLTHEPNAPLDACIYRISPTQPDLGSFVAGIHFDARQSAALRTALSGPGGIPGPCPAVTRFASIVARGDNSGVFLQLGGCWRLQRDQAHASLGSASDPALVARLLDPGHSAPRRSQRHPRQAAVRRWRVQARASSSAWSGTVMGNPPQSPRPRGSRSMEEFAVSRHAAGR